MHKLTTLLTGLVCGTLLFVSCTMNSVSGGSGSDIGNGNVVGTVYFQGDFPAPGTQVMLVPHDYNPVEDGPLPDSLIDTTNSKGLYTFYILKEGKFNVEAVHLHTRARLLHKSVTIEDIDDTVKVPAATLKKPGTIVAHLEGSIDTVDRYVYILGTTRMVSLSEEYLSDNEISSVVFDSIPEGTIENVYIEKLGDPSSSQPFIDTVDVFSNKVTEIDGFVFYTQFTKENSDLLTNKINAICVEGLYKVWFATDQGIARLDNIRISQVNGNLLDSWTLFHRGNSDLPSNDVLAIKLISTGKIRFATLGGSATLMGSNWLTYTVDDSDIPTNFLTDVEVDGDDNLWHSTRDSGLVKFDGTSWETFDTTKTKMPTNYTNTVRYNAHDNGIWFVAGSMIAVFRGNSKRYHRANNSGFISDDIYCMTIDSKNQKWFGRQGGVTVIDANDSMFTSYNSYHSALFTDSVLTVTEDRKGRMWFGTTTGLTRFDGKEWLDYSSTRFKVLNGKGVRSIAFDKFGNTWIGTTKDGVIAFGPTLR